MRFVLAAALLAATAAAAAEGRLLDRVVAVVNDRAVTYCEIETEARLELARLNLWTAAAGRRIDIDMRESTLTMLVLKSLVIEEAANLRLFDISETEVDDALLHFLGHFGGEQDFRDFLAAADIDVPALRLLLERDLRVEKFLRYRLSVKERVSDDEIRAYAAAHKQFAGKPFAQVAPFVRGLIVKDRVMALRNEWFERARARSDIHVFTGALKPGPLCNDRSL